MAATATTEAASAPQRRRRAKGQALIQIRRGSGAHRALQIGLWVIALLVVWRLPYTLESFRLSQVTDALILTMAVVGLNLLTGYTGQVSLGHAAFYGLGAYTTGVLVSKYGWTHGWTFWASIAVCFTAGVLVGIPALRLKGLYLALVTLSLVVIFPGLIRRFDWLTGGSLGIKRVEYDVPTWLDDRFGIDWSGRQGEQYWKYWLTVVLLAIVLLVVRNLVKSRMGRAMIAVRDNPTAAAVMGVNLSVVKTVAFGLSAAIAGLAGSLFTSKLGTIAPESFSIVDSIEFLLAMILGGVATLAGPIVGGLGLFFTQYYTRNLSGGQLSGVILGATLILFMFVAPGGVVGLWRKLRSRIVTIVPTPPVEPPSEPKLMERSEHEEQELEEVPEAPTYTALGEV
jgi:branched-chain amino acid transport system permease protein